MGAGALLVLDTNVLVSALGWDGPEWRVYERVREGTYRLATSTALLRELERVLEYPKFELERTERVAFVEDVWADALLVQPTRRVFAIEDDPDDNHVLARAVTAGADFIVSGDRHLLDLRSFEGHTDTLGSRVPRRRG